MSLSRPFALATLVIIGLFLVTMTAALVLDHSRGANPPPVSESDVATGQIEPTQPISGGTDPTPAAPPTNLPISPTPLDEKAKAELTAKPTLETTHLSEPTEVPIGTPPPAEPVAAPRAIDWHRVQIPDTGIAFEVPANWRQVSDMWAWSADETDSSLVGFNWSEATSVEMPEALLPKPSRTLETTPVNLGWSQGNSYWLELLKEGEVAAAEKHVIVTTEGEFVYDFYASGRSAADLVALEPILDQMLTSVTLGGEAGDPVDVSVRFLASLLKDAESIGYLSAHLRQDVQSGRSALALLGVQEVFDSFFVSWLPPADGHARVQASLNYPGGRIEERILSLIQQDGEWRIDAIASSG